MLFAPEHRRDSLLVQRSFVAQVRASAQRPHRLGPRDRDDIALILAAGCAPRSLCGMSVFFDILHA